MKLLPVLTALGMVLVLASAASAEDVYYQVELKSLPGIERFKAAEAELTNVWYSPMPWPGCRPVLDGEGEIYLDDEMMTWELVKFANSTKFNVRAPRAAETKGRLLFTTPRLVTVEFKLTEADIRPEAKAAFYKAKEAHYRGLLDQNIPGGAWFRHQADEAAKNLGQTNAHATTQPWGRNRWNDSGMEESFNLFSGGRALSENLQLDRMLPAGRTNDESVVLTNLESITVKEMNWKNLIKDAKPELDPLAACIPADQHAIFFPSFQALTLMIDEADANGTPVLQFLEPRSEDADTRAHYQKQLCLGLSELSRLVGPQVIASVAFTGSDPYLRVGTDVAVLFEARSPDLLKGFLTAQQKAAQAANPEAKAVSGDIAGVAYTGLVSPDRSVSSYLAAVANVVLVSNSRSQLEKLIAVAQGGAASLSAQDEYVYFRMRYPRTDKSETGFVVLSDATIRRWCGPRWRIADARRTRAAAVMSELQAAHLDELAAGKAADAMLATRFHAPDAGEFRLTRTGVTSATYGSLNFMTPIAEIPLDRVTRAEADAYGRWRDLYQRNWRQYFDPIALRFTVTPGRLGAELTVMPLIGATEYRQIIDITTGAEIPPTAGDPHSNVLAHLICAVNSQSRQALSMGSLVGNMAPGLKANPFGWLGQSIALYADEDPFWDRFLQATNRDSFFEENFPGLPVALNCEVKNPLSLAAFLTGLHAFVDQSAPGMTTWQNLEYGKQSYVKITSKMPGGEGGVEEFSVYYAVTPRSLVVTLNEPLLKRALDRAAAADSKETKAPAVEPWPGKSICLTAQHNFFDVLQTLLEDSYEKHLQQLAWNNLPILNEWKRLYPDRDPVKFHEQFWGVKLVCPGGGSYVWNPKSKLMESTVFGNPFEPKIAPDDTLADLLSVQFGVTFENQGLSAKGSLNRKPKH